VAKNSKFYAALFFLHDFFRCLYVSSLHQIPGHSWVVDRRFWHLQWSPSQRQW